MGTSYENSEKKLLMGPSCGGSRAFSDHALLITNTGCECDVGMWLSVLERGCLQTGKHSGMLTRSASESSMTALLCGTVVARKRVKIAERS